MNFRGYIDESYERGQNIFALSCILARDSDWLEIERKWNRHIAAKNRELAKSGRRTISRYHASDCSSRHGDFEGWTHDERDNFVRSLFIIFKQVPTFTVAFDVQLDELCEIFPEWSNDRLEAGYELLTTFLLLVIGGDFTQFSSQATNKNFSIKLFHDRTGGKGSYDFAILRAFERMMNDTTFAYRENFTSIAPRSWTDCVALQPADLVAFECLKDAQARLAARESRKSIRALLDMSAFGIHSKTFNRDALMKFRGLIDNIRDRKQISPSS